MSAEESEKEIKCDRCAYHTEGKCRLYVEEPIGCEHFELEEDALKNHNIKAS